MSRGSVYFYPSIKFKLMFRWWQRQYGLKAAQKKSPTAVTNAPRPWDPAVRKLQGAEALEKHLHVTNTHPPLYFKSSLDYLWYQTQCKYYVNSCKVLKHKPWTCCIRATQKMTQRKWELLWISEGLLWVWIHTHTHTPHTPHTPPPHIWTHLHVAPEYRSEDKRWKLQRRRFLKT